MAIVSRFKYIYAPIFTTPARYIDLMGGRGRGGSYTGTDFFLFMITQPGYFRGCFLRQVLSDVRTSLFQDFKDRIDENISVDPFDFDINETTMTIVYRPTGNMIVSKGVVKAGSRTAKLKSLAGITHVLIEEADELSQEDFRQLDLSLRTIKTDSVKVFRIFNPPNKEHWIWQDYILTEATAKDYFGFTPPEKAEYFKAVPRQDRSICAIYSTYHDNIINLDKSTLQIMEQMYEKDPEYFFTVILGLISEGAKGRIYSRWKAITQQEFIDVDARSMFVLDFGLTSPAGLAELKFVKNNLYINELNYEGMTNKEIAFKMCQLGVGKNIIIADSAEPHSISKIRRGWGTDEMGEEIRAVAMENGKLKEMYFQLRDGFNIYPAAKGPGSIKAGISMVKDYNVFYTEGSKNLQKEYINYKWALDKNKFPIDEPIDDFNHLMDPIRYGCQARAAYY